MPYFVNTKKPTQGSNTSCKNNSKYWENISCLIQVSKIMFNFVKFRKKSNEELCQKIYCNILPKIIRKLRCFLRTLIFCIRESDYRKEFSNKVRFVIGMCFCLSTFSSRFLLCKKKANRLVLAPKPYIVVVPLCFASIFYLK